MIQQQDELGYNKVSDEIIRLGFVTSKSKCNPKFRLFHLLTLGGNTMPGQLNIIKHNNDRATKLGETLLGII